MNEQVRDRVPTRAGRHSETAEGLPQDSEGREEARWSESREDGKPGRKRLLYPSDDFGWVDDSG